MAGLVDELKSNFKNGGTLIRLIYVILGIFIFTRLVFLIFKFSGNEMLYPFDRWFILPATFPELLYKPWTLITYMLYHTDIMHIGFNLLTLYWFGKLFNSLIGERKLLSLFILGGISGGILNILSNTFEVTNNVIPIGRLLGASGGVMAIIIAVSVFAPQVKIMLLLFGEVKLLYVGLFTVLLDVLLLSSPDSVGHVAHLGGAFMGWLWVLQYRKGVDFTKPVAKLIDSFANLFTFKPRLKVKHKKPVSDFDYNKSKVENQKDIDKILDKISKGGYDSLSKQEKEILFKAGDRK